MSHNFLSDFNLRLKIPQTSMFIGAVLHSASIASVTLEFCYQNEGILVRLFKKFEFRLQLAPPNTFMKLFILSVSTWCDLQTASETVDYLLLNDLFYVSVNADSLFNWQSVDNTAFFAYLMKL